jgi:hypothetical protein
LRYFSKSGKIKKPKQPLFLSGNNYFKKGICPGREFDPFFISKKKEKSSIKEI